MYPLWAQQDYNTEELAIKSSLYVLTGQQWPLQNDNPDNGFEYAYMHAQICYAALSLFY